MAFEGVTFLHGDDVAGVGARGGVLGHHAFCQPLVVGVVVVEGEFVGDPEADDEGDGHTGGEAGDVDDGGRFTLGQVAPGDAEVIFEHSNGCCANGRAKRVPER